MVHNSGVPMLGKACLSWSLQCKSCLVALVLKPEADVRFARPFEFKESPTFSNSLRCRIRQHRESSITEDPLKPKPQGCCQASWFTYMWDALFRIRRFCCFGFGSGCELVLGKRLWLQTLDFSSDLNIAGVSMWMS